MSDLLVKCLEKDQVEKLLRFLTEHRSKRDSYMFFELMLRTGCRTDEFIRIRPCDIVRCKSGYDVTIYRGSKGSKARQFELDSFRTSHLCEAILERCNAFKIGLKSPIVQIISDGQPHSAKRLMRKHFDKMMYEVFGSAGLKFSLHSLRHTFADIILKKTNKDVIALKNGLGHESLNSTDHYLTRYNYKNHYKKLFKDAI